MALFQAAILGLMAIAIAPGWLFYFDVTPKVSLLFAGAAIGLFCSGRAPRWFSVVVLASLVSLAVSSAVSERPALAVYGTNWRRFGALAQAAALLFAWGIARHAAGYPGRVRTILRGVTAASGAIAIYGIMQYFGWDPILPKSAYHIGEGVWTIVRPPGTLGYVSYFATWLAVAACLAMALAELEENAAWKWVAWGVAVLASIAMLLTGTRAAVLGLAASGAVWLYARGFRISRRIIAAAGIVLLTGIAFYFSPAGWMMRSRARWFVEDPWGGSRLLLWRDSVRMAADRPLLGYGSEVYTAAFPRYHSKELARAYPDFLHESPHNVFLDAWVAQGLPGMLLLAAFCVGGLVAAYRAGSPWLAGAVVAGTVCQQFTAFTVPTAVILFTAIALAAALRQPRPAPGRSYKPAAVLPALYLLYLGGRLAFFDHTLWHVKESLQAGNTRAAADHYARYTRHRFPGSSADIWYSLALLELAPKAPDPVERLRRIFEASAPAMSAPQTVEDPVRGWYHLAMASAAREDSGGTERSLRSAIAAHPNWFKSHWMLARVLQLRGNLGEAEAEAALAVDLNGGKNPEVAQTLADIRRRGAPFQK